MRIKGAAVSGQLVGFLRRGSPVEEYRLFFDRTEGKLRLSIVNPLTGFHLASLGGKFYWTRKQIYIYPQSSQLVWGDEITATFDEDDTPQKFKLVPSVTTSTRSLNDTLQALRQGRTVDTGQQKEIPGPEPQEDMFDISDMMKVWAIFFVLLGLSVFALFVTMVMM
jgi:hypothetical protein